jgi:hypothetical protein
MTSTSPTVPAVPDLVFADGERPAVAGFLAGYRGLNRVGGVTRPRGGDRRRQLGNRERHRYPPAAKPGKAGYGERGRALASPTTAWRERDPRRRARFVGGAPDCMR